MKNKYIDTLALIIILSAFAALLLPTLAFAADAGCYARGSNGSNVFYILVDCNNAQRQESVSNGLCLVAPAGNNGLGNFSEQDCSTFTAGSTEIPTTPSEETPPDNGSGFGNGDCEAGPGEALTTTNCGIIDVVVKVINFMSALAGIVIIGSIMLAGYQYMTAQDNSGQIQQSRQRIIWAISAMLLFIFMYGLLNFLVPGGVL